MATNFTIVRTGDSGQFDWFKRIGATDEAVMTLNDQPIIFTILLVVIITMILQVVFIWYIHFATMKPSQKKKADPKKGGAKSGGGLAKFIPSALRR